METITNLASTAATTASKLIYGDQPKTEEAVEQTKDNETAGKEPISGEQGQGTVTQPYDQGNLATPLAAADKGTFLDYQNNETVGKEPVSGELGKGTVTEPFDQGNDSKATEKAAEKTSTSDEFLKLDPTTQGPTETKTETSTDPKIYWIAKMHPMLACPSFLSTPTLLHPTLTPLRRPRALASQTRLELPTRFGRKHHLTTSVVQVHQAPALQPLNLQPPLPPALILPSRPLLPTPSQLVQVCTQLAPVQRQRPMPRSSLRTATLQAGHQQAFLPTAATLTQLPLSKTLPLVDQSPRVRLESM